MTPEGRDRTHGIATTLALAATVAPAEETTWTRKKSSTPWNPAPSMMESRWRGRRKGHENQR